MSYCSPLPRALLPLTIVLSLLSLFPSITILEDLFIHIQKTKKKKKNAIHLNFLYKNLKTYSNSENTANGECDATLTVSEPLVLSLSTLSLESLLSSSSSFTVSCNSNNSLPLNDAKRPLADDRNEPLCVE